MFDEGNLREAPDGVYGDTRFGFKCCYSQMLNLLWVREIVDEDNFFGVAF